MSTTITLSVTAFLGIIFGLINLLVIGPVAWILKGAVSDIKELEADHDSLKERVLTEYVHKAEYSEDIGEIKDTLNKIFNKLDEKADKGRSSG